MKILYCSLLSSLFLHFWILFLHLCGSSAAEFALGTLAVYVTARSVVTEKFRFFTSEYFEHFVCINLNFPLCSRTASQFHKQHQFSADIIISDESDKLLETGGGLKKALNLFTNDDAPILLHNVDILSNADLDTFYNESKESED